MVESPPPLPTLPTGRRAVVSALPSGRDIAFEPCRATSSWFQQRQPRENKRSALELLAANKLIEVFIPKRVYVDVDALLLAAVV